MLTSKVREITRKNKFSSPDVLHHDVWETINATVGKILHICFSQANNSLQKTGEGYLKATGSSIVLSPNFQDNVIELERKGKGIIILNHPANNFTDTLPLFANISDEILKKTTFYTISQTHKMNSNEFPEYDFTKATLRTRSDVKDLVKNIQEDIDKIEKEGGYIFIIPSGGSNENGEFRAIFQRMVKGFSADIPVLAHHIAHDKILGYPDIGKSLLLKNGTSSHLQSVMTTIGDWREKSGKQMTQYYNSLFPN